MLQHSTQNKSSLRDFPLCRSHKHIYFSHYKIKISHFSQVICNKVYNSFWTTYSCILHTYLPTYLHIYIYIHIHTLYAYITYIHNIHTVYVYITYTHCIHTQLYTYIHTYIHTYIQGIYKFVTDIKLWNKSCIHKHTQAPFLL